MLMVTLMAMVAGQGRNPAHPCVQALRDAGRLPALGALAVVWMLLAMWTLGQTRTLSWLDRAKTLPELSAEKVEALKAAFRCDPDSGLIAYQIGEQYRQISWLGEDGFEAAAVQSIDWFERAAALNPYDPYPWARRGMSLDWLGRRGEAGPSFAQAHRLDPNGYYITALCGWHAFQVGEYRAAKQWFDRSSQLYPNVKNFIAAYYRELTAERMGLVGEPMELTPSVPRNGGEEDEEGKSPDF
jgi:tetratricopeptide (TPR) repeat protein